ncbi:MAG: hypothetical protein OIF50_12680 [Flavobacteriaceae bacterium]|nr:hypothetical protein [Flavobacteriaceae bacterium]
MKIKTIVYSIIGLWVIGLQAQKKSVEIDFSKGVLELCAEGNVKIVGRSGNSLKIRSVGKLPFYQRHMNIPSIYMDSYATDSLNRYRANNFWFAHRKKRGLQPLGNKETSTKDNPYTAQSGFFKQKEFFKKMVYILHVSEGKVRLRLGEEKDVKLGEEFLPLGKELVLEVPHAVDLELNSMDCAKKKRSRSEVWKSFWEVRDFDGKLNMSLSTGRIKLRDVTGPVIANTLDGSIDVYFEDKQPQELYSLISNDGYINIEASKRDAFMAEVSGANIYGNLPFAIEDEEIENGIKKMRLQLNSGGPLLMVNAGYGNVYLRRN